MAEHNHNNGHAKAPNLQVTITMAQDGSQCNVTGNFSGPTAWQMIQRMCLSGLRAAVEQEVKQQLNPQEKPLVEVPKLNFRRDTG